MSLLGVALLSTLIIFSLSVFYFVNRTESEAWRGRQREAARSAAGTVNGFIQRVGDALLVVSIVEPDHLVSDSDELNALLQENTALLEIVRVDPSGRVFANAFRDRSVLANLITIPQSQWFLQAKEGQTFIGDVQLSANNAPYLIMAVPSADKGVVAARVQMDVLWEVVQNIHFGQSGRAYVITRNGRVVAHTDPEMVFSNATIQGQPEFAAMLSAPNNEWFGTYTNFENTSVVGYTSLIPETDWLIITELPLSEAFSATRNAIYVLGTEAFILMFFVSWVVARYLGFLIVKPLVQLKNGAERIGQGELNYRIGPGLKSEIGQLASAFDTMAGSLQQHQTQVEAQTTALKMSEARYRAIVEDQTELICRFLPDGTLTFVNEAYCRYFDKQREDLIGHSFMPLIPEADRPQVEAAFASLNPSNPVVSYQHRVIMPDGSQRWQHWTDRVILSDGARIIEFASVGRDITEQRRAEDELLHLNAELEDRVQERTAELMRLNTELTTEIAERQRAEVLLRQAEAKYRTLVENIPAVVYVDALDQAEPTGHRTVYISPQINLLLGYMPEEITQIPTIWPDLVHPDDREQELATDRQHYLTGAPMTQEYRMIARDGRVVWVREEAVVLQDSEGRFQYSQGVLLDITERKQSEKHLKESVQEKEILLKEIHHRVKNNLQIISSLLNLQANRVTDARTLQALGDSQARVRSMALIHEKLYQSQSLARIDFGEYVKSLATDLFRSYQRNFKGIQLNVQVDEVTLELDQAVSCGLILNELMTNALKYAFPDGRNGTIWVELRANPEHVLSLRVADDGVGIPADMDILKTDSLGLQLVNSLVGQLDGNLELERSNGTIFRISFEY